MDYSTEEEELKIIAVPYKPGGHCATMPTDFVPIIDALESLHGLGYVHGDIRAFNTVFGEQGGLIDFDLGGKAGIKAYPAGYEDTLPDGIRISGRAGNDNVKTLQFHHDWHALGQLMFTVHEVEPPENVAAEEFVKNLEFFNYWTNIERSPTPQDIKELKDKLKELGYHGWSVHPRSINFRKMLEDVVADGASTCVGTTTGTPPKRLEG